MKKLISICLIIFAVVMVLASCGNNTTHTHKYGEWSTTKNPTCTEDGVKTRYCDCGEKQSEAVPATGHAAVIDAAVEPTCTKTGLTQGKHCSVCDEVIVAQTVIDAKGHTEVVDTAVDATCIETGLTDGKHCSVCNEVIVAQETVDALGHDIEVDEAKAPTCTEAGLTAGEHCTRCDYKIAQETVEALGHDIEIDEAKAPTCTETGLTAGEHCTRCNYKIEQNVIDALGHTEGEKQYAHPEEGCPCEMNRVYVINCTVCGAIVKNGFDEPIGHSYTDYLPVKYEDFIPICERIPMEAAECNNCDCMGCVDLKVTGVVPGHTEVIDEAKAPTCTETGLTEGKHCSVCDEVLLAQEVVPALGHSEKTVEGKSPTCSETGLTEGKVCDTCGEILVKQEIIDLLDHSCVDGICTVCGEYIPGLYSADDKLISPWESLINEYGVNVERDCTSIYDPLSDQNSLAYILTNNSELSGGTKLMLDKNITKIGYGALSSCISLTSVVIPDTVNSIGAGAFYHCTSLKNLVIPHGITIIEAITFAECYFLSNINIPDGVTQIGNNAFDYCFSFTEIVIPEGVEIIGDGAFQGCSGATSVNLPDSLTSIGNWAFQHCDALVNISISENVTYIGEAAFANCRALQSITVDENNTAYKSVNGNLYTKDGETFKQYAIAKQNSRFIIPDGVTTIEGSAFSNATQLITLELPQSVVSICDYAFYYCSQLSDVYYGGTLEDWQSVSVSDGNSYLTDATIYYYSETEPITEGNFWYYVDGAIEIWPEYVKPDYSVGLAFELNADGASYSVTGIDTCADIDIIIPSEHNDLPVTSIGDSAFANCTTITSIMIPNSVTSIGYSAFQRCTSLTSIMIPESVVTIGNWAFYYCTNVTEINYNAISMNDLSQQNGVFDRVGYDGEGIKLTIGKSVSRIPAYLFCPDYYSNNNPLKITSVEFEAGGVCDSVGSSAFYRCNNISEVYISDIEAWCSINFTDMSSTPMSYADSLYINGTLLDTNLVLPNTVSYIGSYAFFNCKNLESIDIPNTVASIGDGAFLDCSLLKGIVIPDSVTSIGWNTFKGCSNLQSVEISNRITNISNYAFADCTSLINVVVPNSVTNISYSAFSRCSSLANIDFEGTIEQWNAIAKDSSWNTNTGDYTIYCTDGEISKDGTVSEY